MLEWIITNKEIIKVIYGFLIILFCLIIVLRTDRLFRISLHKGIRYFRNAFFFFGLGFFFRYLLCENFIDIIPGYFSNVIFEYFLTMAGFFLLYSLIWKKVESTKTDYASSLFNLRIGIFYIMALLIVLLDVIWGYYYFMFGSQILLFIFITILSLKNYLYNGKKHKFLKFYFIAMFLSLIAWILNSLAGLFFSWNPMVIIIIYLLNLIIFSLFVLGVIKFTKS